MPISQSRGVSSSIRSELDLIGAGFDTANTAINLKAPLASPAFTGAPTAPTAVALTSTTQIATTEFTTLAVAVETGRATAAEALLAPKASPALTGVPTAPTAPFGTNTTQLATTEFVVNAALTTAIPTSAADAGKLATSNGVTVSFGMPAAISIFMQPNFGGF